MHTEHHPDCHEYGGYHLGYGTRGPALFYGYCHETRRMRMMDYPDYVSNLQTGYQNVYQNLASPMQSYLDTVQAWSRGSRHHKECGCGCHEERHHHRDCHCSCCIKCADVVEYSRCGETRQIPLTLDNDTRRDRDVTLQLSGFATASGKELGWLAVLSETAFKLGPCAEKTVLLRVEVDCSKFDGTTTPAGNRTGGSVSECKVAYATIRAEGCTIRPIVIAVAVLPDDCGAHRTGCQCGCCC
jgi:hypothetical protein